MSTDVQLATRQIASLNPATGEVLRSFNSVSEADVRSAVEHGRAAQASWNALGIRRRITVVREFQKLLHANKAMIARLITEDAGKPYAEAMTTDIMVVLDAARFLIENSFFLLREQSLPHGSLVAKTKAGSVRREAYGVIGIISPWNYPFS